MTFKDAAPSSGALEYEQDQPQSESLIFDLDDTLYPLSLGIAAACCRNIEAYMVEKLGFEIEKVPDICTKLYMDHGTTVAGLWEMGYNIDFDDFHRYIHGQLPYEVLHQDCLLRSLLLSMPQRKYIFTNANDDHAEIVLRKLGLEGCFERVVTFESINGPRFINQPDCDVSSNNARRALVCKPSIEAMRRAIDLAQVDPATTLYFDDSTRNIMGGKAAGLNTVLVGSSVKCEVADYAISSIHNVREAVAEIREEPHFFEELRLSNNVVAVETMA